MVVSSQIFINLCDKAICFVIVAQTTRITWRDDTSMNTENISETASIHCHIYKYFQWKTYVRRCQIIQWRHKRSVVDKFRLVSICINIVYMCKFGHRSLWQPVMATWLVYLILDMVTSRLRRKLKYKIKYFACNLIVASNLINMMQSIASSL